MPANEGIGTIGGTAEMEKEFWNMQLDYLKSTRAQMWNQDYFAFLVKNVWNFTTHRNIVDFGCGYGYLGIMLLPLLPAGSTYNGIDFSEELLMEARKLFEKTPFDTNFIQVDLREFVPQKQYDIALCQSVLRHIPQAKTILKKMVDSVAPSGKVICIEVNRKMENAGLYIHGGIHDLLRADPSLQKRWDDELKNGGRDYMLGIKTAIYMEELGLKDVGIRVNDFVEFVSPRHDGDQYRQKAADFIKTHDLQYIKGNEAENLSFIHARSHLITYGTK